MSSRGKTAGPGAIRDWVLAHSSSLLALLGGAVLLFSALWTRPDLLDPALTLTETLALSLTAATLLASHRPGVARPYLRPLYWLAGLSLLALALLRLMPWLSGASPGTGSASLFTLLTVIALAGLGSALLLLTRLETPRRLIRGLAALTLAIGFFTISRIGYAGYGEGLVTLAANVLTRPETMLAVLAILTLVLPSERLSDSGDADRTRAGDGPTRVLIYGLPVAATVAMIMGGLAVISIREQWLSPEITLAFSATVYLAMITLVMVVAARLLRRENYQGNANARTLEDTNQLLEERVSERTRDLESLVEELEAFSYSVSHDLRAPLRAIDGFSRILIEDQSPELDETSRSHLQRIRRATLRMGGLIDELLGLSRINRQNMKRVLTDLSAIAAEVSDDIRQSDPERSVEWRIEEGLKAHADPNLIRAVLYNLLGNAWKFTAGTEQPVIEFGRMADAKETFFVRDNGAGFNMQYVKKLFGAFQRLHGEHEFPGFGIGLTTVKRIVSRHGGTVSAIGREGEGATFYFTLPQGRRSDE